VTSRITAKRITLDPDPYEAFNVSLGFRVGSLVIVSGQTAIGAQGDVIGVGDFDVQAREVFRNLERVLKAGGSSMDQVVKVTIYLTDMRNFPAVVKLRAKYFRPPYPADTVVEVSQLGLPGLLIEVEALALVDGEID
jgi:reactive intermediate/imine deaminase